MAPEPGFPSTHTSRVETPGLVPIKAPGRRGQQRPPGTPPRRLGLSSQGCPRSAPHKRQLLLGSCSRQLPSGWNHPGAPVPAPGPTGQTRGAPLPATAVGQGSAGGQARRRGERRGQSYPNSWEEDGWDLGRPCPRKQWEPICKGWRLSRVTGSVAPGAGPAAEAVGACVLGSRALSQRSAETPESLLLVLCTQHPLPRELPRRAGSLWVSLL